MPTTGIASAFHVQIDGVDLGLWTSCTGLSAKYEVEAYSEGGQNRFVHKLPGRLTFENIKLKRAVDDQSAAVAAYFGSVLISTIARTTASITLFDADLAEVARWQLLEVIPVSWTGPQLASGKAEMAEEELELAHHGFLPTS